MSLFYKSKQIQENRPSHSPHNVLSVSDIMSLCFFVTIVQHCDGRNKVQQFARRQNPQIFARIESTIAMHPLQLKLLVRCRIVNGRMVYRRIECAPQTTNIQFGWILFGNVQCREITIRTHYLIFGCVQYSRSAFAAGTLSYRCLGWIITRHNGRWYGSDAVPRSRSTYRRTNWYGGDGARTCVQIKCVNFGKFISQLREAAHFVAGGCVHATCAGHFEYLAQIF